MPQATREKVLEFVRQRILNGVPPTVREVQTAFRFRSSGTAREHLDHLVADGALRRVEGLSRGLRLPDGNSAPARGAGEGRGYRPAWPIPILGRVQAGTLSLAVEDVEGECWVPTRYPRQELFALRVRGESMTGAGILPGDLVIVRRQPVADSGRIVVALVDDEATVKILRRRAGRVELHPANAAFPVLAPEPEQLKILGQVVEVHREIEE